MKRTGITAVELLAAIAITAILLALLLPAVQLARESARQAQCRSHLRQIGIALHNYDSSYGMWPAGCGVNGISWHVAILPQIDHAALFQQLNPSAGLMSTAPFAHVPLPLFLCTSDSAPTVFDGAVVFAATSYLGNSGTGVLSNGYDGMFRHLIPCKPELYSEGPIRSADVFDGLSTTAAISEVLHSVGSTSNDRLRIVWNLPVAYTPTETSQFRAECSSLPQQPDLSGWGGSGIAHGWRWVRGEIGYSTYNHVLTPMQPSCFNRSQVQEGIYSSASAHKSSVNVLYSDGHVQPCSPHVDSRIWTAIGSRNGSESVQP
jgi:prepilin-type processing-associated H-X9-DG protein